MKRLLVGYKASDLTDELLAGDVVCHVLDIYHAHAIEKTHPGAKVACSAHLPEGDWDEIRFRTGPKLMSGELSLNLMQEIHLLSPRSFKLDFVGRERDRNDLVNRIKNDPKRVRDFSAVWPASVPGSDKLMFTSVPGCFCHRRVDAGGLALAVVASQAPRPADGTVRVLDMGCGCGLVGFLVAKAVPGVSLVMVDSHSRAVEAATANAKAQGVDAEIILADNGIPARYGGFETFAHQLAPRLCAMGIPVTVSC